MGLKYILVVVLFSADGSTSSMRPGDAVSYQECLEQITDAYSVEYTDSVLTCEPAQVDDDGAQ